MVLMSVFIIIFLMIVFAGKYVIQIIQKKTQPMLSTWIIFGLSTNLSFITYFQTTKNISAGILSFMDALVDIIIILAIVIFEFKGKIKFNKFETFCLLIALFIISYDIFGDSHNANLFSQILITLGYLPTCYNMIVKKTDTESVSSWIFLLVIDMVAFYPAFVNNNILAMIYSVRACLCISLLLLLICYYRYHQK